MHTKECNQCGEKVDETWTNWQCPGGSSGFGSCDGVMQPIGHTFTEFDPTDIDYEELDPGIRQVVARLNEAGFTTTDSGDGKSKLEGFAPDQACYVLDFPHVVIVVDYDELASESIRLKEVVESWGVVVEPVGRGPVWIQADFDPADYHPPTIMLAGVTDAIFDKANIK